MSQKKSNALLATTFAIALTGTTAEAETFSPPTREQVQDFLSLARNSTCDTHTEYPPTIMGMSADGLFSTFDVRFGTARYTDDFQYQTYLDVSILPSTSHLVQTFVIEHECAHHSQGHSYELYDMGFIPTSRFFANEDEADCTALRQLHHNYGYSGRETVTTLFTEFEAANAQIIEELSLPEEQRLILLDTLPERMEEREAKAHLCPIY